MKQGVDGRDKPGHDKLGNFMPRLFTAIEVPPGVAEALDMLRGGLPGARWIDRENYHVTLRFIGDVCLLYTSDAADE